MSASLLAAAIELAFPTRCAGCELPGVVLCDTCRASLPKVDASSACQRCGAPHTGAGACRECANRPFAFSAARCFGRLAPPLSRVVALYKDGGERRLAEELGDFVATAAGEWGSWADALCVVPAARSAVRRRGFDHALAIGRRAAAGLGLPLSEALVRREGRDQRSLGRDARAENVRRAFECRSGEVEGRRLLLIDDVFTTGATLDAAARALLAAGAVEVRAVTAARAADAAPDSAAFPPSGG